MSRITSVSALAGLIGLLLSLGITRAAAGQPPAALPPLPPPDSAPAPVRPPLEKPARATPLMRVPVEFRIAVEDLEKQVLHTLMQKIDPKAEAKLPFVVKGNEREFALGADPANPPAAMPAGRVQLIPRESGARPRLDHLASRPLVRAMVDQLTGTVDLTYRIELRSFKLSASGNAMTCEVGAGFHSEAKAMPGGPPAPPNVRDVTIKLLVTKNLEWNESGKLELKEGTSSVWIDPEAPIVGFPRLDIERVVRLNGILALLSGVIDRELMKRFTGENLPDLAAIAPTIKQKMPLLTVSELTAYPIRGDDKHLYFPFVVGMAAANKQAGETPVAIATKTGPAPAAQIRGRITFDKDGKPEVKLDAGK
jgi:hypothetical protein